MSLNPNSVYMRYHKVVRAQKNLEEREIWNTDFEFLEKCFTKPDEDDIFPEDHLLTT